MQFISDEEFYFKIKMFLYVVFGFMGGVMSIYYFMSVPITKCFSLVLLILFIWLNFWCKYIYRVEIYVIWYHPLYYVNKLNLLYTLAKVYNKCINQNTRKYSTPWTNYTTAHVIYPQTQIFVTIFTLILTPTQIVLEWIFNWRNFLYT